MLLRSIWVTELRRAARRGTQGPARRHPGGAPKRDADARRPTGVDRARIPRRVARAGGDQETAADDIWPRCDRAHRPTTPHVKAITLAATRAWPPRWCPARRDTPRAPWPAS